MNIYDMIRISGALGTFTGKLRKSLSNEKERGLKKDHRRKRKNRRRIARQSRKRNRA